MKLKNKLLLFFIAVLCGAFISYKFYFSKNRKRSESQSIDKTVLTHQKNIVDEKDAALKKIYLFYPDENGINLKEYKVELKLSKSKLKNIEIVLRKFIEPGELPDDYQVLFPKKYLINNIFINQDILYLDFSSKIFNDLNWGTTAELLALKSLKKIIGYNFPEIKFLYITIDGKISKTFGDLSGEKGHIAIDRKIYLR